ncbi:hypothetical protein I317_04012 [Kwoniella heveanensis CBS 569]|uniref:Uncharacterized protein n=1 Tax=Kwoniella heveanensis BCC8398 TaxID=1296120 RepID=A0A1B9GUU3_9TREE|nr:hypothetical protein I316_03357 [Kwoniella heveanensis BCC8398]OCF42161.1 hypothetical protein I317_04012 [Kwoniella heveanensis CBS 569]
MLCRCCTNHDAECLFPPVQAPSIDPRKGLRLPSCVRCALYGYSCSIFDNVPNDHRWYPQTDGTFEHKLAPESVIMEDEARRQAIGVGKGECKGKGKGKALQGDEEDSEHDQMIDERKWEPHFEAYKFIQQNPSVIQVIMEQDAQFQAKGGRCKAEHNHGGGHHSASQSHSYRHQGGGGDVCCSATSSSHALAAAYQSTFTYGHPVAISSSSERETEKENHVDIKDKVDPVAIVSQNLSQLTSSLLRSVEDYVDTVAITNHLESEARGNSDHEEIAQEARRYVHSRAIASLEGFKNAISQIEETVKKKLSVK